MNPASRETLVRFKNRKNPTLRHLYPVEKIVDETGGARNSAKPTGWSGYLRTVLTFLRLCF